MGSSITKQYAEALQYVEAFDHFAEFVELGLAAGDAFGTFYFLPLCHDDTEY